MSAALAQDGPAPKKNPAVTAALEALLEHDTAGDPCDGSRWVRRTTKSLALLLTARGFPVCDRTVARLLRLLGFALRVNYKSIPSVNPADRNAQFERIAAVKGRCATSGSPLVSVDTKRKQLVGNFKNAGKTYQEQPLQVHDHDFRSLADGIAIPYGIYDVLANTGTVVVGTSHDTPYFAVDCLAFWWRTVSQLRYPAATQLTVLADCGGSNGYRPRAWKHGLQYRFCNPHGLSVRVVHYPPGQSKYNPIEHRLFSEISKNWAGCPLVSYETILNYIATTNTVTGLVVGSHFVNDDYPTGIKITKQQVDALNLARHASLPAWNYTISPMAN